LNYSSLLNIAAFAPESIQQPSAWVGHLPFAAWVIQEVSPKIFVELGTHTGNSYFAFCQSVAEAGLLTRCYAVDTWQGDEHAGHYSDEIFPVVNAHNSKRYAAFSQLLRMTFDDAAGYFLDGSIELLHIDGLHTYQAVFHDFETWLPKLAPGAVVMFHDTNVRERNFGVWKLWEELQASYPNNLEFVHSHGLGVLQLNNAPENKKLQWLDSNSLEKQLFIRYFAALGSRQLECFESKAVTESDSCQIADLSQAVTERDAEITNFSQAVTERDAQITNLRQAVTERDVQIANLRQAVAEIYGSTSWWITKPLRFMSRLLRGDKSAVGNSLAYWWRKQNVHYEILKAHHPIWAELRYGLFIRLANGKLKRYFKKVFGHYSSSGGGFFRGQASSGEFVPLPSNESPPYASEYQRDEDFSALHSDIKAIAFYLPQFHVVKENDEWWGNGFTEWTNTRQSSPRFPEHYQPREPHDDIGYYDLSDIETMRNQAEIARRHGIYGFCFYHYWFSGRRLLETPVDLLLQHPEVDINFCLCWANENWTRTWDGMHKDVLVAQRYLPEDAENFIRDLKRYILDPRYIHVDGKPVILVYKPHIIPNIDGVVGTWRKWWLDNTGGELEVWCNRTNFDDTACEAFGACFDAVVEFPPHVVPYEVDEEELGLTTTGHLFDYQGLVADIIYGAEKTKNPSGSFYRSVMLGWDNSARRKEGWSVWHGFSLKAYYQWLRHIVAYTRNSFPVDRRFLFINAWNEWAEGTYLEPDRKYGYASINTTSRALFDLPLRKAPQFLPPCPVDNFLPGSVAVHVHIFFEDLANEMLDYLNRIPYPFDLFVTTDTKEKVERFQQLFQQHGLQSRLEIVLVPNLGRDIGPFLVDISDKLSGYDYIGHFHGKKSSTVTWGDRWRAYLLDNLLGSEQGINAIFNEFEADPKLGLVYPPPYPLIAPYADWGGNEERCRILLSEVGYKTDLPDIPNFPVGNMFWARGVAIKPMLERVWRYEQFEPEKGQVKETLAHAVERVWDYCAAGCGYYSGEMLLKQPLSVAPRKSRLAFFVHYEVNEFVSEADLFYLQELRKIVSKIVVITNSQLSHDEYKKFSGLADEIVKRDNRGFDFGAWRDGIRKVGLVELLSYDEVILANNSCYGPIFPFDEMFSSMANRACDFWSVTGFPQLVDSSRAEAKRLPNNVIPGHLQSYFMVFNKSVVDSCAFREFWERVEDKNDILDVVASYETQLTAKLVEAGFKADCYLPESIYLQERGGADEFNAIYNLPLEMLLLRSPLVKKKVATYANDQIAPLKYAADSYGMFPVRLMFSEL
jgi:lipopolysaccharide biosynthesis protein